MTRKIGSVGLALSVLCAVISLLIKGGIGVSLASGLTLADAAPALKHACRNLNSPDFEGCELSVALLPPFIENMSNFTEFTQLAAIEMQDVLRLGTKTTCDNCVSEIALLETDLATNGTVERIHNTLEPTCERQFPNPLQQECEFAVAQEPGLIDDILSFDPPVTACQIVGLCP